MAVGCSDFTLFGRPLLPKDLVYVEATVVEKTLFATEVMFRYASKKLNCKYFKYTPRNSTVPKLLFFLRIKFISNKTPLNDYRITKHHRMV